MKQHLCRKVKITAAVWLILHCLPVFVGLIYPLSLTVISTSVIPIYQHNLFSNTEFGYQFRKIVFDHLKMFDWLIQTELVAALFSFVLHYCAATVFVVSLEIPNMLLQTLYQTLPFS